MVRFEHGTYKSELRKEFFLPFTHKFNEWIYFRKHSTHIKKYIQTSGFKVSNVTFTSLSVPYHAQWLGKWAPNQSFESRLKSH